MQPLVRNTAFFLYLGMESNATILFRKAISTDAATIWNILRQAILRRKKDGSKQWQDGYPNLETVQNDIEKKIGYVLTENEKVVAYCAVILNDEPAYEHIDGKWLSDGDFYVVHRVAVSDEVAGKGYAMKIFAAIENFAVQHHIFSIKMDTNFDNAAMLHILKKCGYTYCGKVHLRKSERLGYEKLLK